MTMLESRLRPSGKLFEPVAEKRTQELLPDLAQGLRGVHHGLIRITDFVGPSGIPDLVAVVGGISALTNRQAAAVPRLSNVIDAAIVCELSAKVPLSGDAITKRIPMVTPRILERRLAGLTRTGAVTAVDGKGFVRHPALTVSGTMYAFEAKVSDWRRGIRQAMRYATWADAACLVLENVPQDTDALITAGRASGVAISHRRRWLLPPTLLRRVRPELRLLASEALAGNVCPAELARKSAPSSSM